MSNAVTKYKIWYINPNLSLENWSKINKYVNLLRIHKKIIHEVINFMLDYLKYVLHVKKNLNIFGIL